MPVTCVPRSRVPNSRVPWLLMPATALLLTACKDQGPGCLAEPLGPVLSFMRSTPREDQMAIEGSVISVSAVSAQGWQDVAILPDGAGQPDTLRYGIWNAPTEVLPLPIEPGGHYRFDLEHRGGSPETSALVIRDEQGLLFAAVSDVEPGRSVLPGGLEGVRIDLVAAACINRARGGCWSREENMRLAVRIGDAGAGLMHGEAADLGGYRVRCLTAQALEYTDRCADAGRIGVSYVLARAAEDPEGGAGGP